MATILVVDDDDDMRRRLRQMLEPEGYDVEEASLAETALGMARGATPPDVVITDVVMPGMDGVSFYRELVAAQPQYARRVIFLTGFLKVPEVHRAVEHLGVPLLGKPDDLPLVVDAVRLALLTGPR